MMAFVKASNKLLDDLFVTIASVGFWQSRLFGYWAMGSNTNWGVKEMNGKYMVVAMFE